MLLSSGEVRGSPGRSKHGRGNLIPGMPALRGPEALLPKTMPNPGLTIAPGLLNQFAASKITSQQQGALQPMAATPVVTGGNEVVSDGSLGNGAVTYSNGTYSIPSSAGTQVGGNLFESFSVFSLSSGEIADFENTPGVQNILARVTGGSASSINGTLESDTQGANLFLINPAGVMFGPNASLNVSGALTVSTANYIKFADGGLFYSSLGNNDVLSAAAVSAFGFTSPTPAPVSIQGSTLSVDPGGPFSIVSGDMTFDGSTVTGAGSRMNFISVQSAGEALLSPTDPESAVNTSQFKAMGNILMTDSATIDASGVTGGAMTFRCGQLTLDMGQITSDSSGAQNGGAIDIGATESVTLTDTGRAPDAEQFTSGIDTYANGSAAAGDILISAPIIDLSLGGQIGSSAGASSTASASGGRIILNCGQLYMTDEYTTIGADTFGLGAGGEIEVNANTVSIIGDPASNDPGGYTGLIAETGNISQPEATGNGGNIMVTASQVYLANGGQFATTILGSGDAGTITVNAPTLFLDVGGHIVSQSDHFANGRAGDVIINATDFVLAGFISTETLTSGAGGDIQITAHDTDIDGGYIVSGPVPNPYGALTGGIGGNISIKSARLTIENGGAVSGNTDTFGNSGNISVQAAELDLNTGSNITSSTYGEGTGGNITVQADELTIEGYSSIVAQSNAGATGAAGKVQIDVAGQLTLNLGEISSATEGAGAGGKVSVSAGSILLNYHSLITAATTASTGGPAGAVSVITTGELTMQEHSEIMSVTFGTGAGGSVYVQAANADIGPQNCDIAASDDVADGGPAGSVTVDVVGTMLLQSVIDSDTAGVGSGGNVNVTAGNLQMDGGAITASSVTTGQGGRAGNVTVNVSNTLTLDHGSDINAIATDAMGGDVYVRAPFILLEGNSIILADSTGANAGQSAGNILIQAPGQLTVDGGSEISSSTFGVGNGGRVEVKAGDVSVSDLSNIDATSLASSGGGNAGDIVITTQGSLVLNGAARINVSSVSSDAGEISISAGSDVSIEGGSSIASSAGVSGGNIVVRAPGTFYMLDGSIVATAGSIHAGPGGHGGNGGNITLDPEFIVLDDSLISANAAAGQGGNILLDSAYYLSSGSIITASGATSGSIVIASPRLDLSGALVGLSGALVSVTTQLQENCAMALEGDVSSFVESGAGGISADPDELQPDAGTDGSWMAPGRKRKE